MKKQIEQTLLIFERKVLCKIFGPSKLASGSWRIKTNENVYKLIEKKFSKIKSKWIAWLGYLERMEKHWLTKKSWNGNP
jgi:hypothetical protein